MHKLAAFVLAEVPKIKRGEVFQAKTLQSAPHYFSQTIPQQLIVEKDGDFTIKAYAPHVLLAETAVEVEDVFSETAFDLRQKLIDECHKKLKKKGGNFELSEEYAIGVVSGYRGDPEQFFNKAPQLASFLKSEKITLDEHEIEHTLQSQLKYAKDDLIIVDWDGAVVFEPSGEADAVVELLQLANLQLLRHRILDHDLDERLAKVGKLMRGKDVSELTLSRKELAEAFKEVINLRTQSILEFDSIERDIKLIGDWYFARLYDLAAKKFKINNWRQVIKEKLDSIEDIYNIVSENFGFSRMHFLEMVQIVLFFVLQAGWFALIILEFLYFTQVAPH